jgi:peptidoglycan LD-endopeptidase CwlK
MTADARTLKTIATLDAKCQERFRAFAEAAKDEAAKHGCDYVMICGHRTWEQQDELFFSKPKVTKARGGYSNHNFGIAGDFGVFRGKVYLDDSNPALASKVHKACAALAPKFGLEWGGTWKDFTDEPHYQVKTGLTMASKRLIYKREGSLL